VPVLLELVCPTPILSGLNCSLHSYNEWIALPVGVHLMHEFLYALALFPQLNCCSCSCHARWCACLPLCPSPIPSCLNCSSHSHNEWIALPVGVHIMHEFLYAFALFPRLNCCSCSCHDRWRACLALFPSPIPSCLNCSSHSCNH
jgi:hypothetical protein